MDPAHPAYDKLMERMRRAFQRRQVVQVADIQVRFHRRGETFEAADGEVRQALESGVFALLPVRVGGKPAPGRWLRLGYSDDLEDLMRPYLAPLDEKAVEEIGVTISANAALQEMARERAEQRDRCSPTAAEDRPMEDRVNERMRQLGDALLSMAPPAAVARARMRR